jgi:hypothetical protein
MNIHALRGFETAIPIFEWPQTYNLERMATGIGNVLYSYVDYQSFYNAEVQYVRSL